MDISGLTGNIVSDLEAKLLPELLEKALATTRLGSLQGLLDKLHQSGLGLQVAAWLGSGPNQPVTAEQLEKALGGVVEKISSTLTMPPDQVFGFLAKHLPALIDVLSPKGTLKSV